MSIKIKSSLIFILFAYIAIAITGCGGGQVSDDDIVVSWADTSMTVANFKSKMYTRFNNDANCRRKTMNERLAVLDDYLMRNLKIAEGYRLGFSEREEMGKTYNDALDSKANELLYDSKVRDTFITDAMVVDFFNKYQYEVHVKHILIKVEEDVKGKDTLEYWNRIEEVYKLASSGEKFNRLVRKYTEDTTIKPGLNGDLGYIKWGKMVENFERAAWALKAGQISKPVRTSYGYHIIKLIDKRPIGLQINTSHILVKCSKRASAAESAAARDRAKMIFEKAKKKGANFAQLARQYSEDKKTWADGKIGWVERGSKTQEYWDLALTLKDGEVGGPVKTFKGYHVIKAHERRVKDSDLAVKKVRRRMLTKLAKLHGDEMTRISEEYLKELNADFGMKYSKKVVNLVMERFRDKSIPQNINVFSSFTPEERELILVEDKLGGLKIRELVDRFGDHRFPTQFDERPGYLEDLVDQIILPRYLTEVARKEGFLEQPDAIADAKRTLDNSLLPEVEREIVYKKATPDEAEIKKFYKKNIDKYTEEARVTIIEIQVDDKQLAEDLLGRVQKGEDIAKLAQRYSQRKRAKAKKGKLGPFKKDKYGTLSRKAFELDEGDIGGPVKNDNLWSVFLVSKKEAEVVKAFSEARRQIENDARFEKQKTIKAAWEEELKRHYNVKINKSLIRKIWPLVDPLPESLVAQRKVWKEERLAAADAAKVKAKEDQIKLKLQPGSEQQFIDAEGRQIKVKIGQAKYYDKEGKEVDRKDANVRLTPEGKLEGKDGKKKSGTKARPRLQIQPKKKDNN